MLLVRLDLPSHCDSQQTSGQALYCYDKAAVLFGQVLSDACAFQVRVGWAVSLSFLAPYVDVGKWHRQPSDVESSLM